MKANSPVKILLVDDLPENLFALELILADKNYFFVKANSGNEALKILLHEQDFAIILMDVQMPEMDGFETVKLIREIETLNHVPIIFLTASMDNAKYIFRGYQAGGVDFMIKPLVPEILTAKVAVFVELYLKTHQLLFQNEEKKKRADELIIANKELVFQNEEKEKRAAELVIANKELLFQDQEKEKRADELIIANEQLVFQNEEKGKRAAELIIANKELVFQNEEKEKRADELMIANKELEFQNKEKEKRANELIIANIELIYQNKEKGKRADELILANTELAFQNGEKIKRADELIIANIELVYQNQEKGKRAEELIIANSELAFQNGEKIKRADELIVANTELAFQNEEKEKRADELIIANKELVFQNQEKEKRADELIIANIELAFQNGEKIKRADELIVVNTELAFQNDEIEKQAAELIIANKELLFQNDEKEQRAAELINANKELESFNYISSHDLQEPLRKIQIFANRLIADESKNLSDKGKEYVLRIEDAAKRMRTLIDDLLAYSRTTSSERKFKTTSLTPIIEAVKDDFKEIIIAKQATIESGEMCDAHVITFQFYQLIHNLIGNALKFSNPDRPPHITISSRNVKGHKVKNQKLLSEKEYCHITVTDNGIGFAPQYKDHIFEIFKRLHGKEKISGTGIGLTIVKKIVENHNGVIIATGELNKGASFDIYIPSN